MGLWQQLFGADTIGRIKTDRRGTFALYRAIVDAGRQPHWYIEGRVPDTIDGRFAVITGLLCMVLLRLEHEQGRAHDSVELTEIFVDDMDGQLREIGIGDMIVGKHVGRMMGALGGRLGAYRGALKLPDAARPDAFETVTARNLYAEAPDDAALGHTAAALLAFYDRLSAMAADEIVSGRI